MSWERIAEQRRARLAEIIEDVAWMLDAGETEHAIATRLNTTVGALGRRLYRAGRPNLGRPFLAADKRDRYHRETSMSPDTTHLSTLRQALTFWEPHSLVTADDFRAALNTAQIPENARGPLFHTAADKGYLNRTATFQRSTYGPAKGHLLRVYQITWKARTEAEAEAA